MATINPTVTILDAANVSKGHGSALLVTWANITEADTAAVYEAPLSLPDRTVHMTSGGESGFDLSTFVMKGGLISTEMLALTDGQGNAISKAAAAIEAIAELTRYLQPTHSGGAAGQNVTVHVLLAGPRR